MPKPNHCHTIGTSIESTAKDAIASLHETQAGQGVTRHKCPLCAYREGYFQALKDFHGTTFDLSRKLVGT